MLGFLKRPIAKLMKKRKMKGMYKSVVNAHHDFSHFDENNVFDARKYGFSLSESRAFGFPKNDYREYISTWESYQPRILNNQRNFNLSDDKLLFSLVFGNVVNVPTVWATINKGKIYPTQNVDLDENNLYEFLLSNSGGVIKERDGCDGFDVFVFKLDESNHLIYKDKVVNKEDIAEIVSKINNGLIQKRVVQGAFENEIFDRSINTIRMVTMRKKGEVEHEVVAALQRIGTSKSAPVDNFNQGGGSALIDLKTGKLSSMTMLDSIDENGNRIFYDKHPDTGKQIKDMQIPNWGKIKEKIIEVTKKIPVFNYVAWDIALTDDDVVIIETNMKSSLNVFQVHGGMKNSYLGQKYRENGYIKD